MPILQTLLTSWRNLPLKRKMPIQIALPTILITLAASAIGFWQATTALEHQRDAAYDYLIYAKIERLEAWLESVDDDVKILSQSKDVIEGIEAFSAAWDSISSAPQQYLTKAYVSSNPHPVGSKDALNDAGDGSAWSSEHASFHAGFRTVQQDRGYYDLFLFDTKGNLVYSVFKEADFATNFVDGKYAQSELGKVYRDALKGADGTRFLSKFAPYAPSAGAPAKFVASPVYDNSGQRIGVIALQIPVDQAIAEVLSNASLLGETGFMYIVDDRGRALSSSPKDGGHAIFDQLPELPHILDARKHKPIARVEDQGLLGNPIITRTGSILGEGIQWNVILEQDLAEANAERTQLLSTTIAQVAATLALVLLISFLIARLLTSRIGKLSDSVERLSAEDYETSIEGTAVKDELGTISKRLDELKVTLSDGKEAQLTSERQAEQQAVVVTKLASSLQLLAEGDLDCKIDEDLGEDYKLLIDNFNGTVGSLSEIVAELRVDAESIDEDAKHLNKSADSLSSRTENQAATLEQTAAAMEEITNSVASNADGAKEIVVAVNEAREQAKRGKEVRDRTMSAMSEIEKSSGQISQIIAVIEDIAFQTNLLSLNAGVEAARAGNAGQGFAVVASEVRGLAQRSSESAGEIKNLISGSTKNVDRGAELVGEMGRAMDEILGQIDDVTNRVKTIASSASEQAEGITEINSGIALLDKVTQENAAMVGESAQSSQALQDKAGQLRSVVNRFRSVGETESVRSAEFTQKKGNWEEQPSNPMPTCVDHPTSNSLLQASGDKSIWQNY